jgi:subtilase family serine protease
MKRSTMLPSAVGACLLITGAAFLQEHDSTLAHSTVVRHRVGQAVFVPAVAEWQLISSGTTPPSETDCFARGYRCFTPAAMRAAYNYPSLFAAGYDGAGRTIAIIDSFGSPTIASDLHVFDTAFGLQPMCGEAGVTCQPGMPTFTVLEVQGSPPVVSQPPSNGTGQENHFAWAVEVSLDVEWAHATAPRANIILVTTPTAETLGVQGFPPMMNAVQYIVDNHLADIISMSLGAGEGAFGGQAALLQLRKALVDAQANGITVLASSGDGGTTNTRKEPVKNPAVIPYPSVSWPASDPLVTGVGGTRLCTDPSATAGRVTDTTDPPAVCQGQSRTEIAWPFSGGGYSIVFQRPAFQNTLPSGSSYVGSSVGAPGPNSNMRGVPDVGYQASSGTGPLVYLGAYGWFVVGGTSCSAPQWAGLIAIADQISQAYWGDNLGYINPGLYKIGSDSTRYANDFFDVTTGNNQTSAIPGYSASQGWDAVTGLGTPNAANLVPDLVAAVHGQ